MMCALASLLSGKLGSCTGRAAVKFNELVTMYFERFNAMQTLWGIYITIALGLLAFFGTASRPRKTFLAVVMSIGFAAFAVVNVMALSYVVETRTQLYGIIQSYPAAGAKDEAAVMDQVKATVTPMYPVWGLILFHAVADCGVLASFWILNREKSPGGGGGAASARLPG